MQMANEALDSEFNGKVKFKKRNASDPTDVGATHYSAVVKSQLESCSLCETMQIQKLRFQNWNRECTRIQLSRKTSKMLDIMEPRNIKILGLPEAFWKK